MEGCIHISLDDCWQNKLHQGHKDFSDRGEGILFSENQEDSHKLGLWHNLGGWNT